MPDTEPAPARQQSAPVTTLLPPPRALDTRGDVWQSWGTWRQEFDLYATATYPSQQPKEVQAATFLMVIGEDARRTCNTFVFNEGEDKSDIEVLKRKFEAFYKPSLNLAYHEFRFGSRDQKEGESFNEWLTELRILAKSCEFAEMEERMLRSRIILGLKDKKLQEKLISENPSFAKTVEICRAREQGKEQCEQIQAGNKIHEEICAVAELRRCGKCARSHEASNCPAKGRTCKKCGKRNHFAVACRTKNERPCKLKQNIAVVDAQEQSFWIEALSRSDKNDERWSATVNVEGTPVLCKLDTGANCSVIARSKLRQITTKEGERCDVMLNTFFGHQKAATGRVRLRVSGTDASYETDFFVVEEDVPLTLSGSVAEQLGLLLRLASVEPHELYEAAKHYADVFDGLGSLKGVVYHMKLKPGSQGIVRPARRIPLALKDKAKRELDRMEAEQVIQKVTEPTEWASYMVVVNKNEKMRICLNPSELNKALLREHYPMPTLEDIAPSLAGAQYFSTLDAASGFWQIKLDEESSKVCTMSTPFWPVQIPAYAVRHSVGARNFPASNAQSNGRPRRYCRCDGRYSRVGQVKGGAQPQPCKRA